MTANYIDEFAEFVGSVPHRTVAYRDGHETRVWDVGSGPPLVLLHGIAGSRRVFFRLVPLLARQFRVVVPWIRGEERPQRGVTHEQLLDDVDDLLSQLALSDVTLLGVSFGGTLALGFGGRNDPRIARIIVQGTFPTFALRPLDRAILAVSRILPASWGSAYFMRRVQRGPETALLAQHVPGIEKLMPQWCGQTPFRTIAQRTHMIARLDLGPAIQSIDVPLTIAHGKKDRVVPRRYFEKLQSLSPAAIQIEWPEVGHNAALTHPKKLTKITT